MSARALAAVGRQTKSTTAQTLTGEPAPGGGETEPSEPDATRPAAAPGSAGEVVLRYLSEQVRVIRESEPLIREGEPDAVRRTRLAVRRLRSALATFGPLFAPGTTRGLRAELAGYVRSLGDVRDTELVRERLRVRVADEPADLVLGPVASRLVTSTAARRRDAREVLLAELDSERHARLVAALDRLVASPPFGPAAARPARAVLPPLVGNTWRRVRRRYRAVLVEAEADPRRDVRLHQLRKAVRRSRYAAEVMQAATPNAGRPDRSGHGRRGRSRSAEAAADWAARMEDLQDALGAHHDTVTLRPRLRELGVAAHLDGENGFTYGRLHALEQARADEALRRFWEAWERADRKRLRRWWKR